MSYLGLAVLMAASVAVVAWQANRVLAGLADARREVSRYPLYAARDALVRLVALGLMDEREDAWKGAYRAVNNMLSIHERLDLRSVVDRVERTRDLAKSDLRVQRDIELFNRELRRACNRVPEFRQAMEAVDAGFWYAMRRQTPARDVMMIYAKRKASELRRSCEFGELVSATDAMCAA